MKAFFHAGGCLSAIAAIAISSTAMADELRANFNIAPQPLPSALRQFGMQSGRSIVHDLPRVAQMQSPGVVGRMAEVDALERILHGNRLMAVPVRGGYIIKAKSGGAIRQPISVSRVVETPAAVSLPTAPVQYAVDPSEDIIVTARRTDERLQDVPISITVYNQQQISNRNIVNGGDLATYTPSLSANGRYGSNNTSFAIRGFIQEGPTSPSVGVYFADVVAPRANGGTPAGNGAGPGSFFDLQNVQVLKGPQGTLFGRNTTGGAVLLVPQKPTDKWEGYVEGSIGNYEMRRAQAVLNAPLSDNLRIRLGVDHHKRSGYLNNIAYVPNTPVVGPKEFADVNYTAARLSVVADLTSKLQNYTVASYSHSDTNGVVPKMVFAPSAGYRAANYTAQVSALRESFYDVSNGNPYAQQKIEQWQIINTNTWRASDTITLKNIISYAQFRQRQAASLFGDNGVTAGDPITYNQVVIPTPPPGKYNVAQSTFTEELQLQGVTPDGRLTYQAGGYLEVSNPLNGFQTTMGATLLSCTDSLNLQCTDLLGRLTPNPRSPGTTLEGFVGSAQISQSRYQFRNRGVYAQATYELTDQLRLTGGIRYTSDRSSGVGQIIRISFPAPNTRQYGCSYPVGMVQGGTSAQIQADNSRCEIYRKESSGKPTWLIDLSYKPVDDVMVYAKYLRGYRQGSVNVSSYGLDTWAPESVDTYELGAKAKFQNFVKGTFNVAAFWNDFKNQQLSVGTLPCTTITGPGTQCPFIPAASAGISNSGQSRIRGIEAEASVTLFPGFLVDVGYTHLDTKILSITPPLPPIGFTVVQTAGAGGPIPLSPKNKYTITGSYTLPLSPSIGRVIIGATFTHKDSEFGTVSSIASRLYKIAAQDLLNFNVNWNGIGGAPLDVSLFATNVLKEKFYTISTGAAFGFDSVILNEPRMVGMRVRYSFSQ